MDLAHLKVRPRLVSLDSLDADDGQAGHDGHEHVGVVNSAPAVAEISIKKEENHVCNIKIKDESKPIPAKLNQAKRSLSSVSSTRPPTGMKVCICLFL